MSSLWVWVKSQAMYIVAVLGSIMVGLYLWLTNKKLHAEIATEKARAEQARAEADKSRADAATAEESRKQSARQLDKVRQELKAEYEQQSQIDKQTLQDPNRKPDTADTLRQLRETIRRNKDGNGNKPGS